MEPLEPVQKRDLPDLAARLRDAPRLAIDTEFHAERRWMPKLYLVQIHVEGAGTWFVDPLQEGHLAALADVLTTRPWLLHGGQQDMRLLQAALGDLPPAVHDTQVAAALVSETWPAGYGQLVHEWLGEALEKEATLSDWSRRPLSRRQLEYAALDVQMLPRLWDRLAAEAEALGRRAVVEQACEDARRAILDPPSPELAWRELPVAQVLEPVEAAVLQELCAWREDLARAQDIPARSVLGDGVLGDIARRRPITVESLAANRRVPKAIAREHGGAIVERVQRASNRPAWAWPRPVPSTSPAGRVARWLRCWAYAEGHAHRWAPDLVMPKALAEDLAQDRALTRALLTEAIGPWRDELTGDALWSAIQGEVALALGEDIRTRRL